MSPGSINLPPFPPAYRASGLLLRDHFPALTLWHRRYGTCRNILDRSSRPGGTKLVADVATRPHRLR